MKFAPTDPLATTVLRGLQAMSAGREVVIRHAEGEARGRITQILTDVPTSRPPRSGESNVRFVTADGRSLRAIDIEEIAPG